MVIRLHKDARSTPAIRRDLQSSTHSTHELAERYGLSRQTVSKRRWRSSPEDASHRPHRLHTRLTPAQEAVVVEWRKALLLPLDDLLTVTHEFIRTTVSRSGRDRCLRRHGVSNLQALWPQPIDQDARPVKPFKDYEPGYASQSWLSREYPNRAEWSRWHRDRSDRAAPEAVPVLGALKQFGQRDSAAASIERRLLHKDTRRSTDEI